MSNPTIQNQTESTTSDAVEAKLTKAELQAQYAIEREEARAAHDPLSGKFKFQTAAEYKNAYNIAWELAHPNDKDALVPSTSTVLQVVDGAIDAVAAATTVVKAEGAPSKMSLARAIFDAELVAKGVTGLVRKDILKRFIEEAGCTRAGANTYYNSIRDKNGLVNHKS